MTERRGRVITIWRNSPCFFLFFLSLSPPPCHKLFVVDTMQCTIRPNEGAGPAQNTTRRVWGWGLDRASPRSVSCHVVLSASLVLECSNRKTVHVRERKRERERELERLNGFFPRAVVMLVGMYSTSFSIPISQPASQPACFLQDQGRACTVVVPVS